MTRRAIYYCAAVLFLIRASAWGQDTGNSLSGVKTQDDLASAAPSGQPATTHSNDADKLATLEKSVSEISKKLTVFTANEEFKLILGGVLSADSYYNHARPVAPGIPFFLTPSSPFGFNQDTFDANARQTTLFALVSGPKIGGFESSALVAVCLFNDAHIVDRYGILPIQAYAQLKNDEWRFAAGLQFDIYNPINPNTLAFSYLGASGNSGAGFPGQLRVERFFHPADDTQVTWAFGLSEPLPTTVSNTFRISEDNGWPNFETRLSITTGPLQGEGPLIPNMK